MMDPITHSENIDSGLLFIFHFSALQLSLVFQVFASQLETLAHISRTSDSVQYVVMQPSSSVTSTYARLVAKLNAAIVAVLSKLVYQVQLSIHDRADESDLLHEKPEPFGPSAVWSLGSNPSVLLEKLSIGTSRDLIRWSYKPVEMLLK